MKKLFLFLIVTTFIFYQPVDAQSIRRSTLCSVAKSSTSIGNIKVASTFGQNCVSCSVITNDDNFLRQGFQQPPNTAHERPCGFDSGMAAEFFDSNCGTYYNFEYLGLGDPSIASFLWDFGSDASPQTSTDLNPQNIVYSSTGNKFISLVVVGPNGCTETVNQVIQVMNPAFGAHTSITDETCFGDADGSIELEIFNGTAPYQIFWQNSSTETQLTNLKAGDFSFIISDSDGCIWESTATVGGPSAPLSIMTIAKEPESCDPASDGRIVINPQGGTSPYAINWSNGKSGEIIDSLAASAYTVTVTDDHGCTETGGFEIFELCKDGNNIVYNILTPNEDGQNDIWIIEGIENYPNNEVEIFNRWGTQVWSKYSYTNDWRGLGNNGKKLPAGGYYFIVRFNDENDTTIGGSITILR